MIFHSYVSHYQRVKLFYLLKMVIFHRLLYVYRVAHPQSPHHLELILHLQSLFGPAASCTNKRMIETQTKFMVYHGISLYIMVYLYTWCIYISIHHDIYIYKIYICWLVVLTILTNMKVNGQDHPIYYGKLTNCSKPPTSMYISWYISIFWDVYPWI